MTTKRVLSGVFLLGLLLAACNSNPPIGGSSATDGDYVKQLLASRAAKDTAFRNAPGVPVPRDLADKLIPLSYFPPDPDYVATASLTIASEHDVIEMPTSNGEIRKEERVGVLK